MSSSSSTIRTKTSDNQSNGTSETAYDNQSTQRSLNPRQQRSFCPFRASPIQSSFFAQSAKQSRGVSSTDKLNARPFDIFAIGQPNLDIQNGTSIKIDGTNSSETDKNP